MSDIVKNATLRNIPFWVCLVASLTLIALGFAMPPTGEIDGSVLTAVGELIGFAAMWIVYYAMRKGVDIKLQHGKTSVTAGDLTDEANKESYE